MSREASKVLYPVYKNNNPIEEWLEQYNRTEHVIPSGATTKATVGPGSYYPTLFCKQE